jgi:hypothetical protein
MIGWLEEAFLWLLGVRIRRKGDVVEIHLPRWICRGGRGPEAADRIARQIEKHCGRAT